MARTEKFLPAKSKLVVRSKAPATWYTTKDEVVLATDPVAAICPLTGEEVVTYCHKGVEIWFQPRMIRSRVVLEEGDVTATAFEESISLFDYDVHGTDYPNPSNRLYAIGVRMTESVWMMRTSDIPYNLMAEMQDAGCTVDVTLLDRSEVRRKVHRAVAKLHQELAEAVERANRAMDDAIHNLEHGIDGKGQEVDADTARKNYDRQAAAIEKRLNTLQAQLQQSSAKFGINEQAVNIGRLGTAARTLRSQMAERAHGYAIARQALAAIPDAGAQALAAAAAADQVPHYVLADALAEAGDEAAAAALQAAFAETAETFSLVGVADDEAE